MHTQTQRLAHSVPDARHILGDIGNTSFYKLIRDGKLAIAKIGRRTVILDSELQRFVDELAQGGVL